MEVGDVVAEEGLVDGKKNGIYSHEVKLIIGDRLWQTYTRAERVFAFSAANVK